jgi:hypothetical protein
MCRHSISANHPGTHSPQSYPLINGRWQWRWGRTDKAGQRSRWQGFHIEIDVLSSSYLPMEIRVAERKWYIGVVACSILRSFGMSHFSSGSFVISEVL